MRIREKEEMRGQEAYDGDSYFLKHLITDLTPPEHAKPRHTFPGIIVPRHNLQARLHQIWH